MKRKAGAPKGNTNALGNNGGRPSKYKPEYAEQAYELALLGATDASLASFFDISESTLNEWKKECIEFSEALRRGKMIADGKVASALYKRAIGFQYDEVTFEKIDGKLNLEITPNEMITTDAYKKKIVTKLVVPDVGAQINWLKNRQKELWRDKEIDWDSLADADLDKIIQRLIDKANGK